MPYNPNIAREKDRNAEVFLSDHNDLSGNYDAFKEVF